MDPLYATGSLSQPYLMGMSQKYFLYTGIDEKSIRKLKISVVAVFCKLEITMENATLKFSFLISVEITESHRGRNQVLAYRQ